MINKYPYTDFNEYNMDWIIKTVKDLSAQWAETHQEWQDVQTEWENYKNYIDNYFSNLDLTQEVSDKLDQMAADGTIYDIFHTTVESIVSDWISDNLMQEVGYVIDASLTTANAAADAKAAGDAIRTVQADLSDTVRHLDGMIDDTFNVTSPNIFDADNIIENKCIKTDGTIRDLTGIYISAYIPVESETSYTIRYGFGSTTYPTVAYYDSDKTFISYDPCVNENAFTFTTPSGCTFIRTNGYMTKLSTQKVSKGLSVDTGLYIRALNAVSGGSAGALLYADDKVIYDFTNNVIDTFKRNNGTLILYIPGYPLKTFTAPVSISGSGSLLYYDMENETFTRSNTYIRNNPYLFIIENTYNLIQENFNIVSDHICMEIDAAAGTTTVKIGPNAYLYCNGSYIALSEDSYTLSTPKTNISLIYFNFITKRFEVSTSFVYNRTHGEKKFIGIIYPPNIQLSIPYKKAVTHDHISGANILTFGDSLTWYDGNTFDWGPHIGETCIGFQSYLRYESGAVVTNYGQSGKTTPQIVDKIKAVSSSDIENSDYIIIMPSVMNDDRLSVSPGTVEDIGSTFTTTETAGALQDGIEYIYGVNPAVKIILMVEPKGWTKEGRLSPELTNEAYADIVREVADLYSIPLIDLRETSGINELTRDTYLADPPFADGNTYYMYHPNNFGWKILSKIICNQLNDF